MLGVVSVVASSCLSSTIKIHVFCSKFDVFCSKFDVFCPWCLPSGNHRITDSAIKAIAKSCSELRHVYIADCPRLTDLSLKALSSCKYLIVLNIADCVRYASFGAEESCPPAFMAKSDDVSIDSLLNQIVVFHSEFKTLAYVKWSKDLLEQNLGRSI